MTAPKRRSAPRRRPPSAAPTSARLGRPRGSGRPPWESAVSLLAGLPRDRPAWLALVLPALDATTSHGAAAAALGVTERSRDTVAAWHRWLVAELAAGRLPERTAPLPERLPSSAGGRNRKPPGEKAPRKRRAKKSTA